MKQTDFSVILFVHEDGTLAAHGGDILGLVIEADDIAEMRAELLRIAPRLLKSNHGLTEEEVGKSTIRLVLGDARGAPERSQPQPHTPMLPQLLWEDDPRITARA